jgi:hypothetical protein
VLLLLLLRRRRQRRQCCRSRRDGRPMVASRSAPALPMALPADILQRLRYNWLAAAAP